MTKRYLAVLALALFATVAAAAAADDDISTGWITELKVKLALLDKGGLESLPIKVTIDRTTAILTGEVASSVTQELATEVALSVEGVAKVDNRLTVAGEKKMSEMTSKEAGKHSELELKDARLEAAVKLALYREIGANARRLEVEAVQGTVSVRGTLPDKAHKSIAADTVKGTKGVVKYIDLIKVAR